MKETTILFTCVYKIAKTIIKDKKRKSCLNRSLIDESFTVNIIFAKVTIVISKFKNFDFSFEIFQRLSIFHIIWH